MLAKVMRLFSKGSYINSRSFAITVILILVISGGCNFPGDTTTPETLSAPAHSHHNRFNENAITIDANGVSAFTNPDCPNTGGDDSCTVRYAYNGGINHPHSSTGLPLGNIPAQRDRFRHPADRTASQRRPSHAFLRTAFPCRRSLDRSLQ